MVNVPSPRGRRQLINGHLAYLSQVLLDVTLLGGGCVVLRDAFDAADTLETIESERITDLFLVEPQLFDVMDHPDGSLADIGEVGSIEVRSPAMAQGYRNRPDLEAENFRDGWYRPRDLGRIDEEGYLYIIGREADVRWIGGVPLTPASVEETLCQMPEVRVAAVVADEETDSWIAAVVPWDGAVLDARACLAGIAKARGHDAAALVVIIAIQNIPLTEQGKPDREAIKHLARGAAAGQ